jgi:thioredoxin-like negative regulator of GroEL
LALALLALLVATPVLADIVTYSDGTVIKGLTRALPDAPLMIELTSARGTLRVPRSRIAKIEQESPAQGWIHVGDDLRQSGRLADAINAYKKAQDLEPANATAQTGIDQAQVSLAEGRRLSRQQALKKIDDLAEQARSAITQGDFDKSEKLFKQANDLMPAPEQKASLAKQISRLYLAWGHERQDKLDPPGAEAKFNLAVEADKDNAEAINELLKLWENNPEKREQAAHIYETILDRHPDNAELRKKLGDLYAQMGHVEEMVRHYLILYRQSDKWQGTDLERRLVEGLRKLQNQYASQNDYGRAIKTYQVLASIDSKADPMTIVYYQYLKAANDLKPGDLQGRLALAQFAEKNGLDDSALAKYRELLASPETHDGALAGLTRYAQRALAMAQEHFNMRDWSMASTLADQTRKDFPQVTSIGEQADELIGKAQIETINERRQATERAKDLIKSGDAYYAEADQHFQNIFSTQETNNSFASQANVIVSTQRSNMPALMSDRQEAKRLYQLAIQAYQEALRLNPQLAGGQNSMVSIRVNQAMQNLAALNQTPSDLAGTGLKSRMD